MRPTEESVPPASSPEGEPGAALNPGPPTEPRQAASVILLRGGGERLELLLVRRTPQARFMGGVWVFPGGAVDAHEGDGDASSPEGEAHRAAALRELREEASIAIDDADTLVKFSRWITPEEVQIRFDTHFFLAELPPGQEPAIDGQECVDLGWFAPRDALAAHQAGEIELVFPTIKHLEQLSEFASVEALMAYARGREVQPVQPRVLLPVPGRCEGEVARIVLPGEPGY
jgi:8-oxo-dGTP pyrophosphatase MutT (NUDIX family)